MLTNQTDGIELLTLQTLEMIAQTQKAVEKLAAERGRLKLSSSRASAVAKELKQLRIVLDDYKYQHCADML